MQMLHAAVTSAVIRDFTGHVPQPPQLRRVGVSAVHTPKCLQCIHHVSAVLTGQSSLTVSPSGVGGGSMAEQMLHTEMSWGYDEMSWGHLPQVEQVQEEVGNAPDPGGEFRWGGPWAFSCGGGVVKMWVGWGEELG